MGFNERDYAQESHPGVHLNGPQTVATKLVIITVAVYLLQLFLGPRFTAALTLNSDWYLEPWNFYRLLTYGFLHDRNSMQHIVFNMFGLWMFGRDVEMRYGKRSFLMFYLSAIIFAGLLWCSGLWLQGSMGRVIGASGGTTAVIVLFALCFPHRTIFLMMLFPIPAWVLGLVIVGGDLMGSLGATDPIRGGNVAFSAHLAGAAYALLFWRTQFNPLDYAARLFDQVPKKRKPKLKVHDPSDNDIDDIVDPILRKIQEKGRDSLTWKERRILERASREYQQRRK